MHISPMGWGHINEKHHLKVQTYKNCNFNLKPLDLFLEIVNTVTFSR